jgi:hypothetical protein
VEDLERRFGRLPAACILAVAVQLISLSLYAPALWMPMPLRYIRMYEPLVEDPWRTDAHAEPAVRHRLLGPVIAHYLGLRGIWSTIPQWLGVTGFLATLYCLLRRDLDASASFRVVLLIGTTLAVITSQTWMGFQEGIGHFAIVLCLWFGRAWAVIPLLFLGMLAEERTAAAVPFLVCWQFIFAKQQRWVRAIVWGLAGLVTVALWFIYLKWVHTQFLPAGILEQSDWQEMPGTHFYLKYPPGRLVAPRPRCGTVVYAAALVGRCHLWLGNRLVSRASGPGHGHQSCWSVCLARDSDRGARLGGTRSCQVSQRAQPGSASQRVVSLLPGDPQSRDLSLLAPAAVLGF